MFRTLIYPSSGACDYSVELPHWSYCSWFIVCWSFGVVGLEWYPCCSLQHGYHSNPTTPKLQYTSNKEQYDQCGNVVWLEWYPCCRLKHGYHSNPTTPKLQHTSNQKQYDQCGNVVAACNMDTIPNQPHRNSNTHRTKNNTTNVVI